MVGWRLKAQEHVVLSALEPDLAQFWKNTRTNAADNICKNFIKLQFASYAKKGLGTSICLFLMHDEN
jgi:hypothetical protein